MSKEIIMADNIPEGVPRDALVIAGRGGEYRGYVPPLPTGPERPQQPPSTFEQILTRVAVAEQMPETTQQEIDAKRVALQEAREERDRLLQEANEIGLFDPAKESLVETHYKSRVKVSHSDKVEERRMTGEIGVLRGLLQMQRDARQTSFEDNTRLWSNPRITHLEQRYGGAVDYFYRETLDAIATLVKDRKAYLSPTYTYPDSGLFNLWEDFIVKGEGGLILRDDEENPWQIENFNDIREAIEEARKRDPYVPTRNYESWVEFVADDPEELEEMIPYIAEKLKKLLIKGEPNASMQFLDQEKQKLVRALAIFPIESARQHRRLKSSMVAEINTMAAYELAEEVRIDPQAYFHFKESEARAFRQTDDQDHFVDSVLLDRDGLTMMASEEYAENDGEIWRYGPNTRETPRRLDGNHDMGALFDRQQAERRRIERFMMSRKLRSMQDLLNLDNNGNFQGDPRHPAFQRLKAKLDALDVADPARNQPGFTARWQEYCRKAFRWQQEGVFDDPRQRPRVIFQHPLARALTKDEFRAMFEEDIRTDKWYINAKRRRVRQIMKKAERLARSFQFEVTAGGPRHTFRSAEEPTYLGTLIDEVRPYLQIANVNEIVPHVTLVRAILQAAITQDSRKPLEHRRFKMFHLLKEKLGLDIDSPLFAGWYTGAHDTIRPVLLKYIYEMPEFRNILERNVARRGRGVRLADGRDDPTAADEKTTIARWVEDEREFILALEYVIRKKFGIYYNFPGHDTEDGGVKDFRNANLPAYGISRDTVEINGLIPELLAPAGDFGKDWGCTISPWRQLVGLFKGPDEEVFRETGYNGFIENPRDVESWVKRSRGNFTLLELYNRGDKNNPSSHGLLNDGPISGPYRMRTLDSEAVNFGTQEDKFGINHPETGYNEIREAKYEQYVDTSAKVMAPTMAVMHESFNDEDSTYGRNPRSAMIWNTMLGYSIFSWTDRNWYEYRGKFGFAYDATLHLARIFMHTVLYENRLILSDREFDERMVGYTRVEVDGQVINVPRYQTDPQGNTVAAENIEIGGKAVIKKGDPVPGEVHEGILDAFPTALGDEIIRNRWLPFGLNSHKPETLGILQDFDKEGSKRTKDIYDYVVKHKQQFVQERKTITRLGRAIGPIE